MNGYLLDKLKSFDEFENQNIEADKAYFDLRISKGEFEGNTEARLDALLSSEKIGEADCILHFLGDKVSLDEYAVKAAEIAEFFKKNTELKPGFLQIIYYYENNGSRTMQYETRLEFYELEYDKDAIANGIDMHYYIELDENQKTKLRIYNIIKYV